MIIDSEHGSDIIKDLTQCIQMIIPYFMIKDIPGFNPMYLILLPVLIRLFSNYGYKLYYRFFGKENNKINIQFLSRTSSGRENKIFNIINWYLSQNLDKLKITHLSCDDCIFLGYKGDMEYLERIDPIYEIGHDDNHEERRRNTDNPVILYNFENIELRLVPSLESKKIGKDTIEIKVLTIYADNLIIIKKFVKYCQEQYEQIFANKDKEFYQYYEWDDDDKKWRPHKIHTHKNFDNVFLDDKLKNEILKTIQTFIDQKEFYDKVGIPHKKGFVFYGKPGCGKTSTEYAIAKHFERNIYIIRLDELSTSEKLKRAVMQIEQNAIVIFEDIDTHKVTHQRASRNKRKNTSNSNSNSNSDSESDEISSESEKLEDKQEVMLQNLIKMQQRMMMQGNFKQTNINSTEIVGDFIPMDFSSEWNNGLFQTLLEIMDGYNFLPGAIIIFTTNYLEKLDDALIRFGRIDHRYEFTFPSRTTIQQIFKFFFDLPQDDPRIIELSKLSLPHNLSSAELINSLVMPFINDPDLSFNAYKKRIDEKTKELPNLSKDL